MELEFYSAACELIFIKSFCNEPVNGALKSYRVSANALSKIIISPEDYARQSLGKIIPGIYIIDEDQTQ